MFSLQNLCLNQIIKSTHRPATFDNVPRAFFPPARPERIRDIIAAGHPERRLFRVSNYGDIERIRQLPLPVMLEDKLVAMRKERNVELLCQDILALCTFADFGKDRLIIWLKDVTDYCSVNLNAPFMLEFLCDRLVISELQTDHPEMIEACFVY